MAHYSIDHRSHFKLFYRDKQAEGIPSLRFRIPSPTGTKAFYTYVKNNHESVERWSHSPTRLPKNYGTQTLIMVEPYFTPNREEMDAYIDFMEAGHTIVLLKNNPKGMFDVSVEFVAPVDEGTVFDQKGEKYQAEIPQTSAFNQTKPIIFYYQMMRGRLRLHGPWVKES
ncbi:DUF4350 domain-containing protein [Bacillus sp. N9]